MDLRLALQLSALPALQARLSMCGLTSTNPSGRDRNTFEYKARDFKLMSAGLLLLMVQKSRGWYLETLFHDIYKIYINTSKRWLALGFLKPSTVVPGGKARFSVISIYCISCWVLAEGGGWKWWKDDSPGMFGQLKVSHVSMVGVRILLYRYSVHGAVMWFPPCSTVICAASSN